jgi:hypothetical protein
MEPADLGKALGARLVEVEAALERYGAFAFSPGQQAPAPPAPGDHLEAARDFVLRALRTATDPANAALLRHLARGDATLAALGEVARLPRLAVWERVNELVAAGLLARSLEADTAGLTPAGAAVVALCEAVAQAAAEALGR